VLGSFRVEATRAGALAEVGPLVEELCALSPEFRAMWHENDLQGGANEAVKHIRHPVLGPVAFEYSTFAVDGRTDLAMVVYNPASAEDAARIAALLPVSTR
jgi:hypothetical protein